MRRACAARVVGCLALCLGSAAAAFTLADGTARQCVAGGRIVPELEMPAGTDAAFTARTVHSEGGYRIVWNRRKLLALPPTVRDFLFFHECAHARLATQEELAANCGGLRDMRAAGRAGFAVEAKLAAFYGPRNAYWAKTLECANARHTADAAAASPQRRERARP